MPRPQIITALLAVLFNSTYTVEGEPTLRIDGFEPSEDGAYPIVIHRSASGLRHELVLLTVEYFAESFWDYEGPAAHAETCGIIFAFVEYPDVGVNNPDVDDACALNKKRAEAVFTKAGSALSTICAMPKADCSKGVGIFGYISGAIVGAVGANLPGLPFPITAMTVDQMGSEQTHKGEFVRLECMTNEQIEPGLPKEKRLAVIPSTISTIGTTTAETLRTQKEMSGFDCGEDFDCRQANAAGYFVFDTARLLGVDKPIVIGHWGLWHARGYAHYTSTSMNKWLYSQLSHDRPLPDVCKPGCEIQYALPPLSSRRLLFATLPPPEPFQCPAPPAEFGSRFGTYLANEWYAESYALVLQADPSIAVTLADHLASIA